MLVVVFAAFILMLIGALIMVLSAFRRVAGGEEGRQVEGGAVVVVGPLPIVIGTSQRVSKLLVVLAIALLLVSLATYLIFLRGATLWR